MIYFRGCVVREKLPQIANATERILKKAGIEHEILDDENCCGSFLLRTGFHDDAIEVMEQTLKELEGRKILVSCAGCYNTLKNDYKNLLGVELDVIHTSQLFSQLIREGKLTLQKTPMKVTYHDPCHLGRHSGVYDEPREVLEAAAELVEMEDSRERSHCCGAGAGVKSVFPQTANKIAKKRIKDAENTGADTIATACSFCILNLKDTVKNSSENNENVLKVKDLSEILFMGLEDERI
jgi:Fe-S oxidoreductase